MMRRQLEIPPKINKKKKRERERDFKMMTRSYSKLEKESKHLIKKFEYRTQTSEKKARILRKYVPKCTHIKVSLYSMDQISQYCN